jgi:hypothetical protein
MSENDELAPSQTTGYKVSEKKTIEELHSLDANDGIYFKTRLVRIAKKVTFLTNSWQVERVSWNKRRSR